MEKNSSKKRFLTDAERISSEISKGWPRPRPLPCAYCGGEIPVGKSRRGDGKVFCPKCHRLQPWRIVDWSGRPVKEIIEDGLV